MKELERYTHYYRSIFSRDCSCGESEDEKSTEMLSKSDILSFITSYTRKLIEAVGEEIIGEDDECRFDAFSDPDTIIDKNDLREEQRLKVKEIINSLK